MRFLFVYQDYAEQARRLLDELAVGDVTLIIAGKNAQSPTVDEIRALEANKGADAAACSVNRKYRKTAASYATISYEAKKFRFEDQQLREWLAPRAQPAVTYCKPSEVFRSAAQLTQKLVLHTDALKFADNLSERRWRFASISANLLARYAQGDEALGPLRDWKRVHGIEFAANGRIAYSYDGRLGPEILKGRAEWHLKEGDHTSAEGAARIYFTRVESSMGPHVLIFYVGPHPANGVYPVTFRVS